MSSFIREAKPHLKRVWNCAIDEIAAFEGCVMIRRGCHSGMCWILFGWNEQITLFCQLISQNGILHVTHDTRAQLERLEDLPQDPCGRRLAVRSHNANDPHP